jgi:23S rRNA (uracil1939-C5)-methyltransferase
MQTGDKLKLAILGPSHEGSGVARNDGQVVFVDGALPGESVLATIIETGKTFARAKLDSVIEPSDIRVEPFCRHYGDCGGCSLQHAGYEGQLTIKRAIVINAFERIGKVSGVEVLPAIGMPDPYHYRNKAEYRVEFGADSFIVCGFRRRSSHECVDISECKIVPQASFDVLSALREILRGHGSAAELGIKHAVVRTGADASLMLILVSTVESSSSHIKLANLLHERLPAISSIYHNLNRRSYGEIMGWNNTLLYGMPKIPQSIWGLNFFVSPSSFIQVNSTQVEKLYETAVDFAGLTGKESVLDLYCGIGTMTMMLAKKAARAMGIEINTAAVKDAVENAQKNGISNVDYKAGKAEMLIRSDEVRRFGASVAVIDPPRAGCDSSLLYGICSSSVQNIVYVSCDPATRARDVALLGANGFSLVKVQPIDMFPHTAHVETVVLMSRINK